MVRPAKKLKPILAGMSYMWAKAGENVLATRVIEINQLEVAANNKFTMLYPEIWIFFLLTISIQVDYVPD